MRLGRNPAARPATAHQGRLPTDRRLVALSAAVLPGDAAGEPFTDSHDPLGRCGAGEGGVEGDRKGKLLSPARRRSAVHLLSNRLSVEFTRSRSFRRLASSAFNAELVTRQVVGLLGHLQLTADVGDLLALAKQSISLLQLPNDLLWGVSPSCTHRNQAFLPPSWAARLPLDVDQPAGVKGHRSDHKMLPISLDSAEQRVFTGGRGIGYPKVIGMRNRGAAGAGAAANTSRPVDGGSLSQTSRQICV